MFVGLFVCSVEEDSTAGHYGSLHITGMLIFLKVKVVSVYFNKLEARFANKMMPLFLFSSHFLYVWKGYMWIV